LFHFLVKHKRNLFRQPRKQILSFNVITSHFQNPIHYTVVVFILIPPNRCQTNFFPIPLSLFLPKYQTCYLSASHSISSLSLDWPYVKFFANISMLDS
jgi:hypothetical protein